MCISDFNELVCSININGEIVVRSDKCSREYSVRSLLSSILDGPRCITSQSKRDAGLVVFKDSDFPFLSGVELGGGLSSILVSTRTPNVE